MEGIDIDALTIGQGKKLAALFGGECVTQEVRGHDRMPVLVCTDKRAVVFGYTDNAHARPIKVETARMALYWSADVGGVFGLAERGPTSGCKISATAPSLTIEGVTAVFEVEAAAEKAWLAAPVQGR